MYRDGHGEEYLDKGKEMMDKFEAWQPHAPFTIDNKLLLLEAEYSASSFDRSAAIEKYEEAVKSARDNNFVNEQALALEFMGDYYSSIVEITEATVCYMQAYKCYMEWGALAKANKIKNDHNLVITLSGETDQNSLKHDRNW